MQGLNEKIRDFYKKMYPDDTEYARLIPEDSTFDGMTDEMLVSDSFYEYIGTSNEQVRMRIFTHLAELHGITYENVNNIFLNGFKEANGVKYRRDWNCDGCIRMYEPKTIGLYHELKYEFNPKMRDCFFAFSKQQLQEGIERFNLQGKKLVNAGGGLVGTEEGISDLFKQYDEPERRIVAECIPQEVYFYEYNNHECMIGWDGDTDAIKIIIAYWGEDIARTIKRFNASMSISNLTRRPVKVKGLYFVLGNEKKSPRGVWFSDVIAHQGKGVCHCLYDNALYIVYASDGEIYKNEDLAGLTASYDGETIYDFRKE